MITDLRLQNFRSYKDTTFEFGDGVNIIVGPNGSGKTNLLESLLVVCSGASYRAKDKDLVKHGQSWSRLDAHANNTTRTVKLHKNSEYLLQKTFDIGGRVLKRLPLDKILPTVLFEPAHLVLLTGPPEFRRDFLDNLLAQTISGYNKLRHDYRRALLQRNTLLKKGSSPAKRQIFAWNIRLSELGGQIAVSRAKLIENFNNYAQPIYRKLTNDTKKEVVLTYSSAISIENYSSQLMHKLEASQQLDLARGFTSYGPHRDDINIKLAGHNIQVTASRGEIRTLILMLKILELQLLEAHFGKKPILLLDDVFSELDGKRRQALTRFLKKYQTFITTTDADVVMQHFIDKATIIPISK